MDDPSSIGAGPVDASVLTEPAVSMLRSLGRHPLATSVEAQLSAGISFRATSPAIVPLAVCSAPRNNVFVNFPDILFVRIFLCSALHFGLSLK